MIQDKFALQDGDYSDDFNKEAEYQTVVAQSMMLHRGVAWIWCDRLLTRNTTEGSDDEDSGDCHMDLFGTSLVLRARFRGWFSRGVLTIYDRTREVSHESMLPEQVYQHLMRRFKVPFTKVRFL